MIFAERHSISDWLGTEVGTIAARQSRNRRDQLVLARATAITPKVFANSSPGLSFGNPGIN